VADGEFGDLGLDAEAGHQCGAQVVGEVVADTSDGE
jgi:hypothetical protein